MRVLEGSSTKANAADALAEITKDWPRAFAPQMIWAFASSSYDSSDVAEWLAERFPEATIAGCSTSGEHVTGQHLNGGVVVSAIESDQVQWTATLVEGLRTFDEGKATEATDRLFEKLNLTRERVDPSRCFCFMLIDGLSMMEERVAATLADAVEGMPLLGGSAGDDLKFAKTQVFAGRRCANDAVVIVMGHSDQAFEVVKHQHFTTTERTLVITKANVDERRVVEIDGRPAAEAYCAALGIPREELTDDLTFHNPLTFVCNNELYVRSIQKVEADDSIVFYCGIEEGMVLDIGGHHEIVETLNGGLARFEPKSVDLFIGCNCILRALEAANESKHAPIAEELSRVAKHVIGFDTYGEQLNGLHINQTLVGLAFKAA